jgi:4-diphosphocytidyl-2-C-methyl-D-erythritol kinase
VLARPPAGSATGPVYRGFDEDPGGASADPPQLPLEIRSPQEAAEVFSACRNDLEAPAVKLQPMIGEALGALRAAPETLMARMSGSGSACFALCADMAAAQRLSSKLAAKHPDWWTAACRLGGPRA